MQENVRDLHDGQDVQDHSDVTEPRDLVQQPASYAEDEALLNRYLDEHFSDAAFEAIHRRFEPQLRRLVTDRLQQGPATAFLNDVEDIVQRTFLKFHRNREQIDPNKPLQPLLNCIAENVITDYLREQTAEKRDYRLTCKLNQAGPGASDGDGCQLGMGYTDPKSRWIEAAQDAKQVLAELMETLPPNEELSLIHI